MRLLITRMQVLKPHPLVLVLVTFFCNTLLWACIVQPGRAPDEWDHFDYIRHLAFNHTLPVYGQTPRVSNPQALNSETQQPPLFYLLATPFYLLGGQTITAQVIATRIFSVLLGMVTVALTYALGRLIVPDQRVFALTLAILVGFNPMFTFISASISNDTLINAISPALLLLLYALLHQSSVSWQWLLGLGALLGVGVLAKFSIAGGVLASGIVLVVLAWRQPEQRVRVLMSYGAWTTGGLLFVAGWFLARNWLLYGDPSGVLVMSKYNVNPMYAYANKGSFWEMITSTRQQGFIDLWPGLFHGFWGVFDFYVIWMSERIYVFFDVLMAGGISGAGIWALRTWLRRANRVQQDRLVFALVCVVIALVTLGLTVNYSYRIDYQPQGRYLLPALVPVVLAIVVGWEQLLRFLKFQRWALPLLCTLVLCANIVALFTAVAVNYHGAYLAQLATQPDAPVQQTTGFFAAQVRFVAKYSQLAQLEVLVNRPSGTSSPFIWRLQQEGSPDELATAIEPKPFKGLGRYVIDLPQPLRAGTSYMLSLQTPWMPADKPAMAYIPPDQGIASDLGLQVVYPGHYDGANLQRIDYLLRSAPPGWLRGNVQRLLFICVPLLILGLAVRMFYSALPNKWGWLIGLAIFGIVLVSFWAPPQMAPDIIPSRTLMATPGQLLTLDMATSEIDLTLLAGSAVAQKQPPDDVVQRVSLIQPYHFKIDGKTRNVLSMQPPSAITYTLTLPQQAWLHTALALNPQIWQPDKGDGVEFAISIAAVDGRRVLLRRYIDPKNLQADQHWHEIDLDLRDYAGQNVQLTLETLPGPAGDGRYDWAGWAAPVIMVHP